MAYLCVRTISTTENQLAPPLQTFACALTIQIQCGKGLYYHMRSNDCLAPGKCNGKTERAYRALGQCFFAAPLDEDPYAPTLGRDGAYNCRSG